MKLLKINLLNPALLTLNGFENAQRKRSVLAFFVLSASRRNSGARTFRGAGMCKLVSIPDSSYRGDGAMFRRLVQSSGWLVSWLLRRYTGGLSKVKAAAAPVRFAVFLCLCQQALSAIMAGCGVVNKALPNSHPGFFYAVRESRHPGRVGTNSKVKGGQTMPINHHCRVSTRSTPLICSLLASITFAAVAVVNSGVLPLGVAHV